MIVIYFLIASGRADLGMASSESLSKLIMTSWLDRSGCLTATLSGAILLGPSTDGETSARWQFMQALLWKSISTCLSVSRLIALGKCFMTRRCSRDQRLITSADQGTMLNGSHSMHKITTTAHDSGDDMPRTHASSQLNARATRDS